MTDKEREKEVSVLLETPAGREKLAKQIAPDILQSLNYHLKNKKKDETWDTYFKRFLKEEDQALYIIQIGNKYVTLDGNNATEEEIKAFKKRIKKQKYRIEADKIYEKYDIELLKLQSRTQIELDKLKEKYRQVLKDKK